MQCTSCGSTLGPLCLTINLRRDQKGLPTMDVSITHSYKMAGKEAYCFPRPLPGTRCVFGLPNRNNDLGKTLVTKLIDSVNIELVGKGPDRVFSTVVDERTDFFRIRELVVAEVW